MRVRATFVLTLAVAVFSSTAHAATVGDPGARSLTLDDSSGVIFHSVAGAGGSGPVSVDVAPDGSFSVPDGLLSWTLDGTLPQASSGGSICAFSFPNTSMGAPRLTTTAGSGTLDPQSDSADLTLPATYTPAPVNVHVTTSGACGSSSWTWNCSADPVPLTLHLHGEGDDVDLAAGTLHLTDPDATAPPTWICSGGGSVADSGTFLTNVVLPGLQYASSAISGTRVAIDGTLSPGVHEPVLQSPPAGTQSTTIPAPQITAATPATAVRQCVVPKLKKVKLAKAKRMLKLANCDVGKITKKKSRSVKHGRVIKTKPGAGARRQGGFAVKLVVAR